MPNHENNNSSKVRRRRRRHRKRVRRKPHDVNVENVEKKNTSKQNDVFTTITATSQGKIVARRSSLV